MPLPYSSFHILNTEPGRLSPEARFALRELAAIDEVEADREYLLKHVHLYHGLFIGLRNVIDRKVLERAINLQCIVTPTTGLNHIDVAFAEERRVKVLSLQGETKFLETITATAEHTWGMLLSLVRKIPAAHKSVMAGEWVRDNYYGSELRDMTLGVIGYGRLGKMLGAYGKVFGMRVLAHDINAPLLQTGVEFVSLVELLGNSDVISVNLSLNSGTMGLLDRDMFTKVKRGAIFINTARGEIVDEAALLDALRNGVVSGAALDVLAEETKIDPTWLKNNALRNYAQEHDNLLITPHIGGVTRQSVEKTNRYMIDMLADHLHRGLIKFDVG